MKKKYKYKKDGKYYHIDIPENEQEQFLIDNPDAEEVDTSTGGWMMDMDVYGLTDDEKKESEEFQAKKKEKEEKKLDQSYKTPEKWVEDEDGNLTLEGGEWVGTPPRKGDTGATSGHKVDARGENLYETLFRDGTEENQAVYDSLEWNSEFEEWVIPTEDDPTGEQFIEDYYSGNTDFWTPYKGEKARKEKEQQLTTETETSRSPSYSNLLLESDLELDKDPKDYITDLIDKTKGTAEEFISDVQDTFKESQQKFSKVDDQVQNISVEDWNAMTEFDKENNIEGWSDLGPNQKEVIEWDFTSKTPIEVQKDTNGNVTGVFGNMDLEDEMFWVRGDWDHKEAYFENFFEPLVNNGNYTVEVRGGGVKGVPGIYEKSIYGMKGGNPIDGTSTRMSARNYHGIEITHTDPNTGKTTKHTIYESDYEKAGQGKSLARFLDKTMSDSDRIAINKWQSDAHQLYKTTSKKYIDVTDGELKGIEKEVDNMPLWGDKGDEGIFGYTTRGLKQVEGEYGSIVKDAKKKMEKNIVSFDSVLYSFEDKNYRNYRNSYISKVKDYYDLGHISEDQYNEYLDDIKNNKYFWKNEDGVYEGKDIPNPNQLILKNEGYDVDILGTEGALEEYVRDEIVKLKVAELEEKKTGEYKDSIDSDDAWDTLFAIGSNINIRKAINENNVILKKIDNWNKKVDDETGLTNDQLVESINKHIENFSNAKKSELTFDPIQVYNEAGLLYGEGETEEEQQEDLQKKYDAKVDAILKDPENQIEINGDIIEATEEGYNAGGKRIMDKYTIPTQEDFDNKLKEIQGKLDKGLISFEKAEKLWEEYQEGHIQNEKKLQAELENYDKEFQEQYDNVSNKIKAFYKEQEDAAGIVEQKMKNWKEETQNFVFLEDGRKVSKSAFDEYKKHSEILGEKYKIIDGY